ncbi:DUF4249 domain-containing protein [Cytophagaceae bacterium 50C-KIRBA]|uniref:DUF4249 domain-containing protein n=1 Tax=Aquirufa beregesia TaxID=2516556 RepID=A0ABX0EWR6_9BACT|nr:DUF4249 domain-containing protein [Aquirufa beregesia]NGZ45010.1 DUF4249 domain-containing protein [Aquirufa beregesia]
MKIKAIYIISILFIVALSSCEDIVQLESPKSNNYVVVEATLTNLLGPQKIMLTKSQAYFDNSAVPKISGAEVKVRDNTGQEYVFVEQKDQAGTYVWQPKTPTEILGKMGMTYQLSINWSNEQFAASATMRRVPTIDSLLYQFDEASGRQRGDDKPKEGYDAQFFAKDFLGLGDCYRVKTFKNGKLFNDPSNISVIYDGAFQQGAASDGLTFNLPIRRSISPELYVENDLIKVELYSISQDQFNFYSQARLELNNAGLFSRPAANIPTNIQNLNSNSSFQGAGWFGVSAVSVFETKVDPKLARKGLK